MIKPPKIHRYVPKVPQPTMAWVQAVADRAYASGRSSGSVDTEVDMISAFKGPVPRHTDDVPEAAGMTVIGMVLRSDGHVLHSDALGGNGLVLQAGDVYLIDPRDPHWTTTCSDDPEAQLIFAVHVMKPDRRRPSKIAHDYTWSLIAASIEAQNSSFAA